MPARSSTRLRWTSALALAFGLVYHFLQIIPVGILGLVLAGRAVDARVPA